MFTEPETSLPHETGNGSNASGIETDDEQNASGENEVTPEDELDYDVGMEELGESEDPCTSDPELDMCISEEEAPPPFRAYEPVASTGGRGNNVAQQFVRSLWAEGLSEADVRNTLKHNKFESSRISQLIKATRPASAASQSAEKTATKADTSSSSSKHLTDAMPDAKEFEDLSDGGYAPSEGDGSDQQETPKPSDDETSEGMVNSILEELEEGEKQDAKDIHETDEQEDAAVRAILEEWDEDEKRGCEDWEEYYCFQNGEEDLDENII